MKALSIIILCLAFNLNELNASLGINAFDDQDPLRQEGSAIIGGKLTFTECCPDDDCEMVSSEDLTEGLTVDLRSPTLKDGVLSTDQGGVIQAEGIRIQAQTMVYSNKRTEKETVCTLFASGDLILEFGNYYFIGQELEYDFSTRSGVIYQARTSLEPWFFGGEQVILNPDQSFTLINGYITTSENIERNWGISADVAELRERHFLSAKNVSFKIYNVPVFWLPSLTTNLDTIFDAPVRYNFKWGGRQGARASMVYEIFALNRFKSFLRVDYRIKRGLGGGLETYYSSIDHRETFNTINYVANDNSLSNPHEKMRFRFQGLYRNLVWYDKVSINLSWDKLSDRDMATDYNDRGLELDTAGRTQLLIRRQEQNWIQQFIARVRVNQFQSVNQELPTLEISWRPQTLGDTGIIYNTLARASYLDFSYSNDVRHVHDYNSTRVEWKQNAYRPIPLRYFVLTPEAGLLGIYYGNSPQKTDRTLGLAHFGCEAKTSLYRCFKDSKHVVEPYLRFNYLTSPTVSPNHHYIFDIDDGWFQSNTLRLGVLNEWYLKHPSGCLTRPLWVDLYTYGFFDTPTIGKTFPKVYVSATTLLCPTLRQTFETAWDFQHSELDHLNIRAEWTVAENLAIRGEYRHRSRYDWRKADHTNFILDSFRSEKELLHSSLSDRRDTLLATLFYQFTPKWGLLFEIRHGWDRRSEPSYTEFETDLIGTLPSAWNVKLSYQHKEEDDRIAFYFSIGLHKPNLRRCQNLLPCLEL